MLQLEIIVKITIKDEISSLTCWFQSFFFLFTIPIHFAKLSESIFLAHIKKWWWRWNIKGSTRWFSSFAWFPSRVLRVQKKCRKEWKFISCWHQFFNSMKFDSWIKVEINIYWIFFIFGKLGSSFIESFLQSESIFDDECFILCGFWYIQLLLFLFRCFDFYSSLLWKSVCTWGTIESQARRSLI